MKVNKNDITSAYTCFVNGITQDCQEIQEIYTKLDMNGRIDIKGLRCLILYQVKDQNKRKKNTDVTYSQITSL